MNKYAKLTNFVLLITIILTGFSVMNVQSSASLPELKMTTIEGNAEAIEPINFYARISDRQNHQNYSNNSLSLYSFKNQTGSYLDEQNFPKKLDASLDLLPDQLIEEYRSFMRGKVRRPQQYLVTDDWVVYAAVANEVYWQNDTNNMMTISILNRLNEEEQTFSVHLGPQGNEYEVAAVRFTYPELTIFSTTYGESDYPKYQFATFDLESPDQGLTDIVELSNTVEQIDFININHSFNPTDRFVGFQSVKNVETSEYNYINENTGSFVYDTKEQIITEVPRFEEETIVFTDQEKIYVGKHLSGELELYEVNPETQAFDFLGNIQMVSSTIGRENPIPYSNLFQTNMTILDGKLYAYEQAYIADINYPVFQVTDIQTQKRLFHGHIEPVEQSRKNHTDIQVFDYQLSNKY